MFDRMPTLTQEQMTKIHDASMNILCDVGVAFNEEESLEIFKKNGCKVDGKTVFFSENEVRGALESAPQRFTLAARNPAKSVQLGDDDFAFVPGYGAPFIISSDGRKRNATMQDYDNFCKLVQTSKYIDMNGFMMVEPSDIPPQTAHLDMLLSSIVLCDKPFMGSPVSKEGARDAIEMAGLVWGGKDKIKDTPVTVSLINSLSPLQFSEEMAGALIEMARYGQACVLASLAMAGASGPVELAGILAMQNAEILAGLTLAQLVRPGVPIIYGSTSSPMDMRTGGLSIGAPELSMIVSCTAQMARFYHLPSRSGGGLTDANFPDAQAGIESAMALITAVRNGINFILHACGILGAYVAMSYEKFIIDEELCGMLKKLIESIEISDETN
jgi:trimethylamine--corrinoid protein Co-methyltransferase